MSSYTYTFADGIHIPDAQATWSKDAFAQDVTFDQNRSITCLLLQPQQQNTIDMVTSIDISVTVTGERVSSKDEYLTIGIEDIHGNYGVYTKHSGDGYFACHIKDIDQILEHYSKDMHSATTGTLTIFLSSPPAPQQSNSTPVNAHVTVTLHGKSIAHPKKASNETYNTSDPDTMFASAGYDNHEGLSWG